MVDVVEGSCSSLMIDNIQAVRFRAKMKRTINWCSPEGILESFCSSEFVHVCAKSIALSLNGFV